MTKIKTHSGAKKRFRVSSNGVIMHARSNKNHGMIKWNAKRNLHLRSMRVVDASKAAVIKRYLLPNSQ